MNPGDAEVPNGKDQKNMEQQAREAADILINQIQTEMASEWIKIEQEKNPEEQVRMKEAFKEKALTKLKNVQQQAHEAVSYFDKADKQDDFKEKAKEVKRTILEVNEVIKKGVDIGDKKVQTMVQKLAGDIANGRLSDAAIVSIEDKLGRWIGGGEPIIISSEGQEESNFDKAVKSLVSDNPEAGKEVTDLLKNNSTDFGKTQDEIKAKYEPKETTQDQNNEQYDRSRPRDFDEQVWIEDKSQYLGRRFTGEQLKFLETLYSPEKFINHIAELANKDNGKRLEIANKLKEYYQRSNQTKTDAELNIEVDKQLRISISNEIGLEVGAVVNQLFLELQQKTPDKFYDEIVKEDIFHGPEPIKHKIQAAINKLYTRLTEIEKAGKSEDNPLYDLVKNIKLFRFTEQHNVIDEFDGKPNPRLKPLPYPEEIDLSGFLLNLNVNLDHTIHKMEFLHNVRAMFNHPPGKEGFYSQLSHYAESLKGTDIDEIMMLPDGQMTIQAYHLYDKMLEEDFASIDWKHRTNQFSNQLESVNTSLENEVIAKMRALYPNEPIERIRHSVNSAVGMARGMFLTEPEKSAYADAVDVNGVGLFASYSTNDAGSLNVFNPLHTGLRWQGEHLWPMFYFMPIGGGNKSTWDHKDLFNNMGRYMESFKTGKGSVGRGDLFGKELFADTLMDIGNVGGPAKRKGWRMKYSLEGHFVTDMDGTLNVPETFKAMEAIGYEAIFNFITTKQAGAMLSATEKTAPGQVKERNDLFKYIFKRYFCDGDQKKFSDADFESYMTLIGKKGEAAALKKIKTSGLIDEKSFGEQVALETSNIFLDNTLAHYVASKFPSKFLRMTRNRFTKDGKSRWQEIYELAKEKNIFRTEKGMERDRFNEVMKDLTFAEMLLRKEISQQIKDGLKFDPKKLRLNDVMNDNIPCRLDADTIRKLLSNVKGVDEKGTRIITEERINEVIELHKLIRAKIGGGFLDGDGAAEIKKYTFTFGLEDTDLSLIAFRGTGPRMIARALGDTGNIENNVIPWIIEMPRLLNQIAISGKNDFGPIIEYLQKAQKAINQVHGTGDFGDFKYIYKIASAVIQYFKKDTIAKPLFGLFGMGKRNSIAAEYAGRSGTVWEWDSRDIDRFCIALESLRLLPKNAYDLQSVKDGKYVGGKYENIWIINPITKKPMKTIFTKRKIDYQYNSAKLRKEFGGDFKSMAFDYLNEVLPIAVLIVLWQYIKKSLEEAEGKKK